MYAELISSVTHERPPLAQITFDPRIFISPPYITCPEGHTESFGVLSIGGAWYTRRCRECFVTKSYPLPELTKKVIYIDQFAISNMMKALNDEMESHEKTKAEPFWLEMFDALERVSKLQLVVCPDSSAHRDESLMWPYFGALKRMYEQLSHGISFHDAAHISDYQVNTALSAWLKGEVPQHDLNPERVTSGRLNEWQDRLLITVDMKWPEDIVEGIRKFRDSVHEKVGQAFEHYKKLGEKEKDFEFWFEHERQHGADAILIAASNYGQRVRQMIATGDLDLLKLEGYRSRGYDTFRLIRDVMLGSGIEKENALQKIEEFINSDAYKDAPANRIAALMWAAIGHQAAHGRKNPPNQGMSTDITTVSTLLPYCDAMFMDRECAALLANLPKRFTPGFDTKVFSPATRAEFIAFLRQIEANADGAVIAAAGEVYGDTWLTPFRTMYKIEKQRKAADS
jgi:hypothetical protein